MPGVSRCAVAVRWGALGLGVWWCWCLPVLAVLRVLVSCGSVPSRLLTCAAFHREKGGVWFGAGLISTDTVRTGTGTYLPTPSRAGAGRYVAAYALPTQDSSPQSGFQEVGQGG